MAGLKSARGSFQQLLLFAFLLITALLVGVALRSVFQYDALMTQSRNAAARALTLSGAAQSLAERSAGDGARRRASRWCSTTRCCAAASTMRRATPTTRSTAWAPTACPPTGLDLWRAQLGVIEGLMSGAPDTALARESSMAMQFRDLDALNTNIAQQAQFLIETQNNALAQRIENARRRLMRAGAGRQRAGGGAGAGLRRLAGAAVQAAASAPSSGWARTGSTSRSTSAARPTCAASRSSSNGCGCG